MIIKTLSNKDITLIKRALRNLLKTQLLNSEALARADFLMDNLDKDDKFEILDNLLESMQRISAKEILATDYDENIH